MTATRPATRRPARTAGDVCPWCDQSISHKKFEEIRARIQEEEQKRAAEAEAEAQSRVEAVRDEAAAAVAKAKKDAKRKVAAAIEEGRKVATTEMEAQLTEAKKAMTAAERALTRAREREEKNLTDRLQEQAEALEKDKLKAVSTEKAKAFAERQKLDEKLKQLQRQLQKETANELGEGAEIDLFDELKAAFPDDEIKRVKRGEQGADIIHTVIEKKRKCGIIVYDSKNRTAWRNDYVTKLRRDQLAAKADHAILACHTFPARARQLHVRGGVILANPARVVVLARILRDHLVQLATVRVSNEARARKVARLYDFITSDHCTQLFDQIDTLSDAMLDLEVKEKKAHDATWKQRGELIRSLQQARGELVSEIDLIIATSATELREAK